MIQANRILAGLVGRDILASRSPWLHEHEADAQGLRLVYSLYDFAARGWSERDLPHLLDAAERLGVAGLNITYPYKQAVIPLLTGLSAEAERIGAVNTIRFEGGRRIGHNTDVIGFYESVQRSLAGATMRSVVQVGAGGAGSATAQALLDLGVECLTVFDVDVVKRDALVAKLRADFGSDRAAPGLDLEASVARADGAVNATPMGMAKQPDSPVPPRLLRPELWVADIVYFPLETSLLREARMRGCRTLNGSGMVVFQAAAAFDIFTGLTADRDRMLRSFVESARAQDAA
ncbi:shikimate dehydrogenase [Sphingomonas sp. AOB5]|uniref:shikimate dehydrogenase n=1 Tax=Sphingomonas sp. AOB5 TaxID=3034017 RepID=UPI0023F7F9A6|nr:shikimate dehydrogenase [Sphingomonas sp. AOB5]MDF7775593.1 shikimate dehydrogenase [Sphingomonas sp. AOB5]